MEFFFSRLKYKYAFLKYGRTWRLISIFPTSAITETIELLAINRQLAKVVDFLIRTLWLLISWETIVYELQIKFYSFKLL